MRSGSSAHDGRGWSPAQHPQSGRGPQPEAEFDSGEYRQLVESSYGYAADGRHPQQPDYTHVDPRQGPGYQQQPGAGYQPAQPPAAYRRPVEDYDYGYGDPGYADPSYDGPPGRGAYQSAPVAPAPAIAPPPPPAPAYQAPAYQPPSAYPPAGYQQPWPGSATSADQVYPVTGAQEVYREEPRRYEEPRYEEPRYEEHRAADPRLEGLRYDELRYDDGDSGGDTRYDEPLDDDAWYAELRRGGPAFQPPNPSPAGPAAQSGPRPDSYQQGPGYDRSGGYPPAPGNPGNNGNGYGGYGPRMSAVPAAPALPAPGAGSGPMVGLSRTASVAGAPGGQASPVALGFQAAPTFTQPSSVGVLAPPAGSRYQTRGDAPQAALPPAFTAQQPRLGAAPPAPAAPARPDPSATAAMPAMTGPDTAAWDIEAEEDDELVVLEQYWEEEDGGYSALLDEVEDDAGHTRGRNSTGTQPAPAAKRAGRRRGGSSDHRLWLGLVGVAVVAAGAIFGIVKFEFPSNSGPSHELIVPASVASYQWAPKLESGLGPLINKFRAELGSSSTNVVAREYQSGSATAGSSPQLVAFIGGHLPNQSPTSSLHNFMQDFKGAQVVSAGPMGGDAACTQVSAGTSDSAALCVWFDNDSVGVIWSPTMSAAKLDPVMLQFRPYVEHTAK